MITQDLGGYGRASERLLRTPSAISLQMKRLQEEIGVPLFRKQGRKTLLTEQGEIAVRYARRVLELNDEMIDTLRGSSLAGVVRIGFGQDFVVYSVASGTSLALVRFTRSSSWRSRWTWARCFFKRSTSGDLDLVLTLGGSQKKTAHLLSELPLHWIASPRLQGSRKAAVAAGSLQPTLLMSDTGARSTGKCRTPLARCHDEPQPDGLVGRCQCGTWD